MKQKYYTQARDARGVVIGDENTIYQYFLTDERYRTLTQALYNFTALIEDKIRNFVGREFVFEALATFLHEHDRGYFVIKGEPGIGKTTLLAHLAKTRGYIHHFNDASLGIVKPDQFLENICVQLIARYGLDIPYNPVDARRDGGYLGELLDTVNAKLERGQKAVILIDALDEAERSFDPRSNILFLPSRLPQGLYFAITSRPVSDFPLYVETPAKIFFLEADSEGNLLDVRRYLRQMAGSEEIQAQLKLCGIAADYFVKLLQDKSEGNFMYLRYVVPEIAAGKYPDLDLEHLPQGLMGYYERHWRQMRTIDEDMWIRYRQPVICFLAAARDPVSVEQLASFSQLPVPRVNAALRDWKEFLDEQHIEGELRYRIYHTSFQDFLQHKDEVGEVNLTQTHSNIADVLLEWREKKRSR